MTKCLYCNEPLSRLDRLWDEQFCDEEHRQRYMQESRWKRVPLRLELPAPPLCGLAGYDPGCSPLDVSRQLRVVRPMGFPKAQKAWPTATNSCTPRFRPETEQPLPLPMPAVRNAPRQRFVYRWGNQATLRTMMKEAATRVRMREGNGTHTVCDPAGEMIPVEIAPMPLAGGSALHWQAMAGLDETALESIRVTGSSDIEPRSRSFPQLGAFGNPVVKPCPMEKPKTETPLALLESARSLRGIYIPLVSIPLLRPRIAFGPRPGTAGAQRVGERSGVIIPIRDFQPGERPEAPPLARII